MAFFILLIFTLKILRPLVRGFLFTSLLERSKLPKRAVPGEVKYKISVPDDNRDETGEIVLLSLLK